MSDLVAVRPEPAPVEDLVHRIRFGGRALVALSGGVDSAVVASLAHEALGGDAMAVTLTGVAVSRAEVDRAAGVARAIGIEHHLVPVDPLASPEYRANPSDRCYFCRELETGALRSFGADRGIRQYLDGVHLDDLGDVRPGLRAMDEAGFVHPLLQGRWTKADIRAEARARELPNWDQPSDACLASRVAHGEPITATTLQRVERAEGRIRADGFRRVRVRVSGNHARIEVDPAEVGRLSSEPLRSRLLTDLALLGFERVDIDPRGYRGSGPSGGTV